MDIYSDIPRFYTALAEWMACLVYISLFPKRFGKGITIGICSIAIVLQSAFFIFTADMPLFLWIPVMMMAVSLMYGLIALCTKGSLALLGYHCAKAFLAAEFAASLEWLVESLIAGAAGGILLIWRGILLLSIYIGFFWLVFRIEKKMQLYKYCQQITGKETFSAVVIAVFSFLFSNISYVVARVPLEGNILAGIFYMRMLGELCGIVILYAYQTKVCEYILEKELTAIQSMYKRQYDQYRYYQSSMEMIHIKYHDLKHQITGLRGEKDEAKREEWLDQLEHELDENRLLEQTGNHVLDTILGAKIFQARKNHIRITCVADGRLLNFMHVTDICTIFGNALDNAIESVATLEDPKKRMIHVTLSKQKNFVLINISNYIADDIELEKGELPKTSKINKEDHGYGLKSIQKTIDKYEGSMSVQGKNHWFELRILLPDKNDK